MANYKKFRDGTDDTFYHPWENNQYQKNISGDGIIDKTYTNPTPTPTTTTISNDTINYDDVLNRIYSGVNAQKAQEYLDKTSSPFSYDVYGSALYNQYKDQYSHQARLASEDAMGRAAALTGGYGNSYAQTVATQAYNNQMEGLNDIAMQLYQMAYNQWSNERDYNMKMAEYYNGLDSKEKTTALEQLALMMGDNSDNTISPLENVPDVVMQAVKGASSNEELNRKLEQFIDAGLIDEMTSGTLYNAFKDTSYLGMTSMPDEWEMLYDGGWNFVGIDDNAKVKTPNGEEVTLSTLKKMMINQGATPEQATEAIKKLQNELGISSNWFFGW